MYDIELIILFGTSKIQSRTHNVVAEKNVNIKQI